MDREIYQGYPNIFTYDADLTISNDEVLLDTFHDYIRRYPNDLDAADAIEAWIKDEWMGEQVWPVIEENVSERASLFVKQLFDSALDQVDWRWLVHSEREEMALQERQKRRRDAE